MRVAPAVVLALVMSACVATEEGGPSEPSVAAVTTTTAAVTTTTKAVTTTVAEDECEPHPDGYNVTRKGLVCPPSIPVDADDLFLYLPGTYRTRVFAVPFEFTRHVQGQAAWEADWGVGLDVTQTAGFPWATEIAAHVDADYPTPDFAAIAAHECASDTRLVERAALISGVEADLLDLVVICDFFWAGATPTGRIDFRDGDRWHLYALQVAGTDLIISAVATPVSAFDGYFTDVVQPIIDSIRFLDQ